MQSHSGLRVRPAHRPVAATRPPSRLRGVEQARAGGRGGSIVNVSSGASQLGSPGVWIHYAATKGAIDTITIGLAKEGAAEGIRVNAVRPGAIDTEIHAARPEGQLERMRKAIPLGRLGTADEVAHAILWLASGEASYVTAALLDVRGGVEQRAGRVRAGTSRTASRSNFISQKRLISTVAAVAFLPNPACTQ